LLWIKSFEKEYINRKITNEKSSKKRDRKGIAKNNVGILLKKSIRGIFKGKIQNETLVKRFVQEKRWGTNCKE
jgi:hypothetical protein